MVYTRIGRDIGMTIWKKMRASDAPSSQRPHAVPQAPIKKPLQIR